MTITRKKLEMLAERVIRPDWWGWFTTDNAALVNEAGRSMSPARACNEGREEEVAKLLIDIHRQQEGENGRLSG